MKNTINYIFWITKNKMDTKKIYCKIPNLKMFIK